MTKQHHITIGIAAVLLLGGLGYYVFEDIYPLVTGGDKQSVEAQEDAEKEQEGTPEVSVTPFGGAAVGAIPDLSKEPVVADGLDSERQAYLVGKMGEVKDILREDPSQRFAWLDLASYRKLLGDYEGALEVWGYMGERWPNDHVPFLNAADVYTNYLESPALAEEQYRKAIARNPEYASTYIKLHQLYLNNYEAQRHLADDILFEGLENLPEEPNILAALGHYYAGEGNVSEARNYYEQAVAAAQKYGDPSFADMIQQTLESLE